MVLETKNIRYAHSDGHTDVCYGSDGRSILTCGSDGNVRAWDGSDDDDPSVNSVAERTLAVACSKDQFFVATDNNHVQAFTFPGQKRDKIVFRFSAPVTHITVSPSGKFLAAGSCDMEIQVLNTVSNKIITLSGHSAPILSVSLDPLEEFVVSSSCDGTIKIWDITSRSVVKTLFDVLPVKNDFFKAICLGRTAWKSVSGSAIAVPKDLEIIVYKRGTWEVSYTLKSSKIEKSLSIVLFSPCGNYVAAASSGGEIIIWEIKHKSEVCHYKDLKKVGISGMAWHPDGSEIAFTDKLGRLGVLTGINEEISKHVVPKGIAINEAKVGTVDELDNDMDTNEFFDDEVDVDDDDEDCISLEKIKADFKTKSQDEEAPGSPGSTATDQTEKEPSIPFTKPQPAFQPSSTPSHIEPRCLCFNSIGVVRYYDSDKTIDVQFHDTMFHHALFLRSFGVCTMATLSTNVLCLGVPSLDDNLSKLSCVPLSSWAGSKEWTVHMPESEDIVGLAAAGNWVAVATNANHLRIFTHAGTQKQIVALPGPVVSLSGYDQKILTVCHMGMGVLGSQNEGFIIYDISNLCVRATMPFQPLPLFPNSVLKWVGFSDEGTPCVFDSEGLLRLLGHDSLHWEVVCDFRNQRKSASDHYFIIGLSEKYQNVRCVLCKNSFYPLIINIPAVLEIPLKLPLCETDTEKSVEEETFWRLMFSIGTLERSWDKSEYQGEIASFEHSLKQTALKLFAEACRNSEDLRALDVATFMSSHPLELAVKYASKMGKMYLAEKLNNIRPLNWRNQYSNEDSYSTRTCSPSRVEKTVYSQQDLFEDCPSNSEKENIIVDHAVKNKEQSSGPLAPPTISPSNPFKKIQSQKSTEPKGLKYFDSLMTKEAPKVTKPQFPCKPLKLKPMSSNKEKTSEPKTKKPTFVQWFSTRKASLTEEYPNVSASELTKLGMKIYKREMSQTSNEDKEEVSSLNFVESKKRLLEEESESETKKSRGLEDDFQQNMR